jgi:hypothetical protein
MIALKESVPFSIEKDETVKAGYATSVRKSVEDGSISISIRIQYNICKFITAARLHFQPDMSFLQYCQEVI